MYVSAHETEDDKLDICHDIPSTHVKGALSVNFLSKTILIKMIC